MSDAQEVFAFIAFLALGNVLLTFVLETECDRPNFHWWNVAKMMGFGIGLTFVPVLGQVSAMMFWMMLLGSPFIIGWQWLDDRLSRRPA